MTGLEALQKWTRKHYRFEFCSGTYVQPGDEAGLKLTSELRSVEVSEIDMAVANGDDDKLKWPTLDELVFETLRLWDADPAVKTFHVLLDFGNGRRPATKPGLSMNLGNTDSLMCYVEARNDAEAIAIAVAAHPGSTSQRAWERKYVPAEVLAARGEKS